MDAPKPTRCRGCKALSAYPHCAYCTWWVCKNRGCRCFGDERRTVDPKEKP